MAANKINAETKRKFLTVYIPDTRGVTVSRYGKGNLKIGMNGVYTYSRLPGHPDAPALGGMTTGGNGFGTCPGATDECQAICYAARPVAERGVVAQMWKRNSESEDVPEIPEDCKILRIHVSGDFTSIDYIEQWYVRLREQPDVRAFAYTRSWRVPGLLPALETLRALPNMQLFASMDKSTTELPPTGWRRAWIADDDRIKPVPHERTPELRWIDTEESDWNSTLTGVPDLAIVCPEETGRKANCEECRFCIDGKKHDVVFLKH